MNAAGSSRAGVTMIELLLSVALLAVLFGVAAPATFSFRRAGAFRDAGVIIAETLRRAALFSASGYFDDAWGAKIEEGAVTLFRGGAFSGRDASFDERFEFAEPIRAEGDTEIVFMKNTGAPSVEKVVTLHSSAGDAVTVSVNVYGAVAF